VKRRREEKRSEENETRQMKSKWIQLEISKEAATTFNRNNRIVKEIYV